LKIRVGALFHRHSCSKTQKQKIFKLKSLLEMAK
jgi:hypothetical protein